jgi:hypothetical protein
MIINVLVILFLVLMAYIWATFQGFFTAFIQLIIVIAAGAMALALWEPLTLRYLIDPFGAYAWGVGLLGPFLFFTVALRAILSQMVSRSVAFFNLFDTIGGAVCGLLSGVLVAGITVIGIGFLPLPADFGGIAPYRVNERGEVVAGEADLWIPVDRYATAFFNRLSAGSLRTAAPLRTHQPDLARQAALFRLRPRADNRLIVGPDNVYIRPDGYFSRPLPIRDLDPRVASALGPDMADHDAVLLAVNTRWHRQDQVVDPDHRLRVLPSQVRLISWDRRGRFGHARMHPPIAATHAEAVVEGSAQKTYRLIVFDTAAAHVVDNQPEADITFLFIVPADRQPASIMLRNLRVKLGEPRPLADEDLAKVFGQPPAPPQEIEAAEEAAAAREAAGDAGRDAAADQPLARDGPIVGTTDQLPLPIAGSAAERLELVGGRIASGQQFVTRSPEALEADDRWIESIATPQGAKLVRVRVAYHGAQSLLGRAREAAMLFSPLVIVPDAGEHIVPIAYVWLRANGDQQIRVEPLRTLRAAQDLPLRDVGDDDALYLYYPASPGVRITSVRLGNRVLMDVDHTVR